MTERERVGLQTSEEARNSGNNRVLIRLRDLPSRKEFKRSLAFHPVETPIEFAMAVTDVLWGGFERVRAFRNRDWLHRLPRGNGEAVILETGLLGWKGTVEVIGEKLKHLGYEPFYVELPRLVNYELLKIRAQLLLKESYKGREETGRKVKWFLWSKGVLTGACAIAEEPEEVPELVDHIVRAGEPLNGSINRIVGWFYLATQRINQREHKEDDFDYLDELRTRLGYDAVIRIPTGIEDTRIDTDVNGIVIFQNGKSPNIHYVKTAHTGLGFNDEVLKIIAYEFAGKTIPIDQLGRPFLKVAV